MYLCVLLILVVDRTITFSGTNVTLHSLYKCRKQTKFRYLYLWFYPHTRLLHSLPLSQALVVTQVDHKRLLKSPRTITSCRFVPPSITEISAIEVSSVGYNLLLQFLFVGSLGRRVTALRSVKRRGLQPSVPLPNPHSFRDVVLRRGQRSRIRASEFGTRESQFEILLSEHCKYLLFTFSTLNPLLRNLNNNLYNPYLDDNMLSSQQTAIKCLNYRVSIVGGCN